MRQYNHKFAGIAVALVLAAGCSDSTTSPAVTPAMTISLTSLNLSVQRGQSQTFPITISRSGGFTGSVFLTVTGLPQDLTAGCDPASVLGNTTTLTVTAGAAQSLGSFTATVKATASGVPAQTKLLTITVTQ